MTVTREQLYAEVWAEPMLVVAQRHGVSASYLARICECLNVPRPARGYWARVQFGKQPKVPELPLTRPGDETEWSPGTAPAFYSQRRPARARRSEERSSSGPPADEPRKHTLLVGLQEYYDAARVSQEGYLRPNKRLLPDIYVSKDSLARALETANQLFLTLEKAGCRVMFAVSPSHRPELDQREKPGRFPVWQTWHPARPTVVLVNGTLFTLTLYEISEVAEVRYVDGHYVRADAYVPNRRSRSSDTWTTTQDVPSGRLALRACASDWRAQWQMHWRESKPGQLNSKFRTIRRELKEAVPVITERIQIAEQQAEIERRRWEAEAREQRRQERAERRVRALKESREHLLDLVENWARARRIEEFFEDAIRRSAGSPTDMRESLVGRLKRARQMLGGTNALERFESWKAPEERDPSAYGDDAD
jgi:hypothetical protein